MFVFLLSVQAEAAALSPFRQLSTDVQEVVLAQPDAGQSPLPRNLSPEDECEGVVAMVEGGLDNIHSKAAADWMNLSTELKDAEAKASDLKDALDAAQRDLAASRDLANGLQAERNALSERLGEKEQELNDAETRLGEVVAELQTTEEEAQKLGDQVAEFVAQMDQLEGDLAAEKTAVEDATREVRPPPPPPPPEKQPLPSPIFAQPIDGFTVMRFSFMIAD